MKHFRPGWGVILLAAMLWGCSGGHTDSPLVTPTPILFNQWAVAAKSSADFGFPDWSAVRATGPADVTGCVDDPNAWASARGNGLEWLELAYAEPIRAREVRIYQTLGRGAVARVRLLDEANAEYLVWEGTDSSEPCPGVLRVQFPLTDYRVKAVRIELDESRTGFWNEIDAVELIGEK